MRWRAALFRLLHVGLLLALVLGVVIRPSLSNIAELHVDQHRSSSHPWRGEGAALALHDEHHADRETGAARDASGAPDSGHGFHALMHLNWVGGAAGHLSWGLVLAVVDLGVLQLGHPSPAAACAVPQPDPFRPPIA